MAERAFDDAVTTDIEQPVDFMSFGNAGLGIIDVVTYDGRFVSFDMESPALSNLLDFSYDMNRVVDGLSGYDVEIVPMGVRGNRIVFSIDDLEAIHPMSKRSIGIDRMDSDYSEPLDVFRRAVLTVAGFNRDIYSELYKALSPFFGCYQDSEGNIKFICLKPVYQAA